MKKILLAIPACLFLFAGCSDDNDTGNPGTPVTYTGMTDFFTRNAVSVQQFTIDATNGDSITGSQGTIISFPAGAFVDLANNPVTGNISIKLQEIYRNKDMFFTNVSTNTYNGRVLISGGMFNMEASQNGMPVRLSPGMDYVARLPKQASDPAMMLFTGERNQQGTVVWNQDSLGWVFNTTIAPYCYVVEYNYFGWINCDDFANVAGPNLTITVNTTSNPNPDSTYVTVWVNDRRGMWRLDQSTTDHSLFGSVRLKDMAVTFIASTIHDGKIYAGFRSETTLTNNTTYDVSMTEMTDAAFKAALDGLD